MATKSYLNPYNNTQTQLSGKSKDSFMKNKKKLGHKRNNYV